MYGYIYRFTFLPTLDGYVGKHKYTKALELDQSYGGSGKKGKKLINQYDKSEGPNLIVREIIEWCETLEELNEKEIYGIAEFDATKNGFNISPGGDGGFLGEESVKKIVATRTANGSYVSGNKGLTKETDERVKELSMALLDREFSDETREKLSISTKARLSNKENHPMYGRHGVDGDIGVHPFKGAERSIEHCANLSKSLIENGSHKGEKNGMYGVHRCGGDAPGAKKVLCVETGQVFSCMKDANEWLKNTIGHGGHIGDSCKGIKETICGFHGKFVD